MAEEPQGITFCPLARAGLASRPSVTDDIPRSVECDINCEWWLDGNCAVTTIARHLEQISITAQNLEAKWPIG